MVTFIGFLWCKIDKAGSNRLEDMSLGTRRRGI